MNEMQHWSRVAIRNGEFDGFALIGTKFIGDKGKSGWWIISQDRGFNAGHDFWIDGGHFYGFAVHIFDPAAGGRNTTTIWDLRENAVAPAEKVAVLAAIERWESQV